MGLEEREKEQRQTLKTIGIDSREPPPSSPDAKADDCTGDCTWGGMNTKQRKKQQCFETHIKTPIYSPLKYDIPQDKFPNISLIYSTMKTCQTVYIDTALIFYFHFNVLCYYFKWE